MQLKQPALRLAGYSSSSKLEDIFASQMVDVAYLIAIFDDYALVVPDEPEHTNLDIEEDREWLIAVVKETLKMAGEGNVQIVFMPAAP